MSQAHRSDAPAFEVDALLFDIDGTLVDSTLFVERLWRAWGRAWSIDPEEVIAVAHGRRSVDVIAGFVSPANLDAALQDYERIKSAQPDDSIALPGTAALLPALPEGRWAAVTSGKLATMTGRMRLAGLPMPRVMVTAEDVRRGKPDPEGYLLAAARLGVAAERCAVFEDAPAGVAAGRAAGALTVGVGTSGALETLGEASLVVADLTRLRIEAQGSGLIIHALDSAGG